MNATAHTKTRMGFMLIVAFMVLALLCTNKAFADELVSPENDDQQTVSQEQIATEPALTEKLEESSAVSAEVVQPPAVTDEKTEPTKALEVSSVTYKDDYQVIFAEGNLSRELMALKVGDDATAIVATQGLASTVEVTYSDGTKRNVVITRWVVSSIEDGVYILRGELAEQTDSVTGEALPEVSIEARPTIFAIPDEETGTITVQDAWSEGAFDGGPSYVGNPIALPSGAPGVMTGSCFINSGFDTDFVVSDFSGGLSSQGNFHCADYSAAEPNWMWANYYAVAVNYSTTDGWIQYKVCVIPDDAATGATNWTEWGECLTGYQRLVGYCTMPYVFNHKISVNKTSANPGITNGNNNYSLEGAIYFVYSDVNCTNKVGELITDTNGNSNQAELAPGIYYVKESKAPKGYRLDDSRYTVDLRSGDQVLLVKDRPATDPVSFAKKDADKAALDNGFGAQGDATVAGAEYSIEYHTSTDGSGVAVRKWVFRSNEKGTVSYDAKFLISGDALYYDTTGQPTLPVGSVVIYETKAPVGYKLNSKKFIGRIYQSGDGVAAGFAWVSPVDGVVTDPVIRGGVSVAKVDAESGEGTAQGEATLGAVFGIINRSLYDVIVDGKSYKPGEEVGTITADAKTGIATSKSNWLPYGTYYVYEKQAPTGYLPGGANASYVFLVRKEGEVVSLSNAGKKLSFANQVIRGGIVIEKTVKGGPISDLEGIGFAVYDSVGNRVSWTGSDGNVVDVIYLGADGKGATPDNALPYGHYRVEELADTAPSNIMAYRNSNGLGFDVVGNINVSSHQSMYTIEVVNYLKPEIDVVKIDGDAYVSGKTKLITAGSTWVLERKDGDAWTVLQMVETVNGKASFDRSIIDRFGTYRLREIASPAQYENTGWMMPEGASQSPILEFVVDEASYKSYDEGVKAYGLDESGHELVYGVSEGGRALIVATALNWRYRTIGAHKIDSETGAAVSDTYFVLEKWNGDGKPVDMDGPDSSGEWIDVASGKTDGKGDILFEGLICGFYRLTETVPNPAYMGPEEGGTIGLFYMEVNTTNCTPQIQVVEDRPIHIMTTVEEATIKKTSVGLVYKDSDGRVVSNVGNESYKYEVGFSYGKSNTFADEYWVEDNLEMTADPCGLRLNIIITPVVKNDVDGWFYLLVKTALGISGEDASEMVFTQPELHAQASLCDGAQRFCATGWRLLGRYSATEASKLVMSELLIEGDYVTALALCYGAVEEGFATETKLTYYMSASHELAEGTEIPDSVESHVSRNWAAPSRRAAKAVVAQEAKGLFDDASDEVETIVVGTFDVTARGDLYNWSSGYGWTGGTRGYAVYGGMPRTGDTMMDAVIVVVTATILAMLAMVVSLGALLRRRDVR